MQAISAGRAVATMPHRPTATAMGGGAVGGGPMSRVVAIGYGRRGSIDRLGGGAYGRQILMVLEGCARIYFRTAKSIGQIIDEEDTVSGLKLSIDCFCFRPGGKVQSLARAPVTSPNMGTVYCFFKNVFIVFFIKSDDSILLRFQFSTF